MDIFEVWTVFVLAACGALAIVVVQFLLGFFLYPLYKKQGGKFNLFKFILRYIIS